MTSAEMRFWFRSTIFQPFRVIFVVVVFEAEFDQIASAANALQNVFDVMRERGDGLADGRQSFGLHHGGIVSRVFDGQRGLMGDGDHQLQMFLVELVGAALLDELLG